MSESLVPVLRFRKVPCQVLVADDGKLESGMDSKLALRQKEAVFRIANYEWLTAKTFSTFLAGFVARALTRPLPAGSHRGRRGRHPGCHGVAFASIGR